MRNAPRLDDQASGLRRLLGAEAPRLVCIAAAEPRRAAPYALRAFAELEDTAPLVDLARGELARVGRHGIEVREGVRGLQAVLAGRGARLALAFADGAGLQSLKGAAPAFELVVLVSSAVPAALTAAYAMLKRARSLPQAPALAVDAAVGGAAAARAAAALEQAARAYLGRAPRLLGALAPQAFAAACTSTTPSTQIQGRENHVHR